MGTEIVSRRFRDIDAWDPPEILEALIEGQFAAVSAVRAARPAIEAAAAAVEARLSEGAGRLVYVGAGTSGRLAVQDGAELKPTFSWPDERLLLLIAGGDEALLQAVEGAEDDAEEGAAVMRRSRVDSADVVIGVAASGTTPYTVAGIREARALGALTIGIANNPDTPLLAEAECPIRLDTGPEAIAGSTRMKAGTAQKITLNLLSSLLMIRLGRVYRGLMVDVQATNQKLVRRSEEMLVHLTGRAREEAREALRVSDGSVKVAMLVLHGADPDQARMALHSARGGLREALSIIGADPAGLTEG